jgi:uncharacterized protein YndB with AHSA1/START domain
MAENNATNNTTTNLEERVLIIDRIFDAPRKLVFKVFTEPEHVARWWGPFGYTIPVCKIDLRPGGVWHYCMRSPEGHDHWVKSVYREIIESERIVYTSTFADEDANPVMGVPEHQGTVIFAEQEGKTKLITRIQFASVEDLKTTLEMGMAEGLTVTLNQLADYLKEIQ